MEGSPARILGRDVQVGHMIRHGADAFLVIGFTDCTAGRRVAVNVWGEPAVILDGSPWTVLNLPAVRAAA